MSMIQLPSQRTKRHIINKNKRKKTKKSKQQVQSLSIKPFQRTYSYKSQYGYRYPSQKIKYPHRLSSQQSRIYLCTIRKQRLHFNYK